MLPVNILRVPVCQLISRSILDDAASVEEGFEPPCDGVVGVVLYPVGCKTGGPVIFIQALMAQVLASDIIQKRL
jgi:hypothetical protein